MSKRKIEIFSESCPKCDEAISLVNSLACDKCEVIVYDVKNGRDSNLKYGITRYPSIAVNGKLLDCCINGSGPSEDTLKAAGIGNQQL